MKTICKCLLAAFMALGLSAQAKVASFGQPQPFNDGWRFILADDAAFSAPEYADTAWRALSLPHDWSVEGIPSPTLASCTGYLPGGIGWYRKTFTKPADGQPRHYLYFDGVYNRSDVYINGHHLGHRPNGYVSFAYDITPYLVDGENVVAVRVDHSRYADSRWYTGSGIYRDVYLVAAPESHFGLWGIGWKATDITDKQATVVVDAAVENPAKGMAVAATLTDAEGRTVATAKVPAKEADSLTLKVKNPQRWDLNDPYLYTLSVSLMQGGRAIDTDTERVGLRTLEFDPNTGFALNGRNLKVKGVCLHHDAGVLGAAVPREVWKRRLTNLKGIGANAIRMSHNPQAPDVYDLCDELGLLVMDEVSDEWEFPKRKWIEGWNQGTPGFDGTADFFEEWIERDITDMVRRDRNHPCIFLWSIGNEVDYPNDPYSHPVLDGSSINQPMFGGYDPKAPNAERIGKIAKRLTACVKAIDDSRPVTGALAGVVMSNQTEYPEAVDVVGYNYTENRYAEDHATYPDRVIYGSETGVGYDAWRAVADNPYIFGQFVWTGTDYLGESGRWPSRGLNTGLLNFASLPKPRGQFRASLWLDEPFTYVGAYPIPTGRGNRRRPTSAWVSQDAPAIWNYDEGQPMRVVCYTNAPAARLELNGEQVGELKPYDAETGIIYWDLPFAPGTLKAVGCTLDGTPLSESQIVTSGLPYALRARWDGEFDPAPGAVNHVLVEVVDADGNLVTLADNMISCVANDAIVLGLEGCDNTDMTAPKARTRRVNQGRLLAYVRNAPGAPSVPAFGPFGPAPSAPVAIDPAADPIPCTLTFTSPLLRPATLAAPGE